MYGAATAWWCCSAWGGWASSSRWVGVLGIVLVWVSCVRVCVWQRSAKWEHVSKVVCEGEGVRGCAAVVWVCEDVLLSCECRVWILVV